jgi:hypothetical protein
MDEVCHMCFALQVATYIAKKYTSVLLNGRSKMLKSLKRAEQRFNLIVFRVKPSHKVFLVA